MEFESNKVIPSEPALIDRAIAEISELLSQIEWLENLDLVMVAIREAVSNALVHGNRSDPMKPISISVTADANALTVMVKDAGTGFDPASVPNPSAGPNILNSNGRGVFLMRRFMDEVEFCFDGGTEVRMRRSRRS